MGAPMPEVSLRARKCSWKCPCVHARQGHKGLCTKVCVEILVSLGVFGLLGPKVGTEQHKGLCTKVCAEQ